MTMPRILVVEDNPTNLALVRQILEEFYEVDAATNGQDGAEAGIRDLPDLIVMDLGLPKLDGWGAVVRLRADPRARHIPVVALTAHAMVGDADRALRAGFDAHLSKPVDEDELLTVIRSLLGDRNAKKV